MKRNTHIILGLTLGGLLAAGTAFGFGGDCGEGGPGPGMRGDNGPGMNMHGGGALAAAYHVDNLTADQRTQLDALRDQTREQMRKEMEQAKEERQALRDAMSKGADAQTIRPLADKAGKRMADMIVQHAEQRAAVDNILTAAQRQQLQDEADDFSRRGRGHGRGMK